MTSDLGLKFVNRPSELPTLSTATLPPLTEEPSGTQTFFLEDGSVQICYRDFCGWVSSAHLIVPKALQLKNAYYRNQKLTHNQ